MALLYGFNQLADLRTQRAVTVERDLMISAFEMTVAEYNAELNSLVRFFAEDTTLMSAGFTAATIARSQPLDQNGRSKPIKVTPPYTVGWPIWSRGNAHGANYVTNQKMTVEQIAEHVSAILQGDFLWNRDQIFGAIFNDTTYTVTDEQNLAAGTTSVYGLANADATTFALNTGSVATDTHLLGQAAAIADATNPFPTIYTELMEHPENAGGEVVVFHPANVDAAVQALTNFVEVGDTDIAPAPAAARLVGTLDAQLPPSATVVGKTDRVWNVLWPAMPDSYLLGIATGGAKPLRRRLDPEPELQGFKPVAQRNDFPYYEEQWFGRSGFGAWNRVGAVVYRISNATYAVPTNFGVPMR